MAGIAFGLLSAAPTIISGVASLVHGVEGLFGKSNGAAKKAAVLSAFQGGVEAYGAVAGAMPNAKLPEISGDTQKALETLIDAVVGFYNALGIFQHTPAK